VLVDLTDLQSMDPDCVLHLAKIMDLFKAHGVGLVVRVDPDPAEDIGSNFLSVIHYRGKVSVVICDMIAEAARALIASFRPIQPKLPIHPRHQVPAPPLQAHIAS
jgi:hypothetical protein